MTRYSMYSGERLPPPDDGIGEFQLRRGAAVGNGGFDPRWRYLSDDEGDYGGGGDKSRRRRGGGQSNHRSPRHSQNAAATSSLGRHNRRHGGGGRRRQEARVMMGNGEEGRARKIERLSAHSVRASSCCPLVRAKIVFVSFLLELASSHFRQN